MKTKAIQPSPSTVEKGSIFSAGLRALQSSVSALQILSSQFPGLSENFEKAANTVLATRGRLVVTGAGKSGHIARKLAATFASTGTPSFFVHPTEASHGDLGMITPEDAILALSWSGETVELGDLIRYSRRFRIPLIALTGNGNSTLGRAADTVIALPAVKEACPLNLAPTSSTLVQLAMGDAIAVAVLEQRGFTASSFKTFHPGGSLAARLMTLKQLMHEGDEVPLVQQGTKMSEVLLAIAGRRFGCVGVVDEAGRLTGIVTDGDLRRHMNGMLLQMLVEDVMTPRPVVSPPELLASAALEMMNSRRITVLFIVQSSKPIGIVHIHDLLKAGVA